MSILPSRALLLFLCLLILAALAACGPSGAAAVVDGQEISKASLEDRLQQTLAQYSQDGASITGEAVTKQLREQVLNEMIDEILLVQKGRTQGIDAGHEDVLQRHASLLERFGGERGLQEQMGRQNLSGDDLLRIVIAQTVLLRNVNELLAMEGEPTEEEIRDLYTEVSSLMEVPEYAEARDFLVEELKSYRWEELAYQFLAGLRAEADIQILL